MTTEFEGIQQEVLEDPRIEALLENDEAVIKALDIVAAARIRSEAAQAAKLDTINKAGLATEGSESLTRYATANRLHEQYKECSLTNINDKTATMLLSLLCQPVEGEPFNWEPYIQRAAEQKVNDSWGSTA